MVDFYIWHKFCAIDINLLYRRASWFLSCGIKEKADDWIQNGGIFLRLSCGFKNVS